MRTAERGASQLCSNINKHDDENDYNDYYDDDNYSKRRTDCVLPPPAGRGARPPLAPRALRAPPAPPAPPAAVRTLVVPPPPPRSRFPVFLLLLVSPKPLVAPPPPRDAPPPAPFAPPPADSSIALQGFFPPPVYSPGFIAPDSEESISLDPMIKPQHVPCSSPCSLHTSLPHTPPPAGSSSITKMILEAFIFFTFFRTVESSINEFENISCERKEEEEEEGRHRM